MAWCCRLPMPAVGWWCCCHRCCRPAWPSGLAGSDNRDAVPSHQADQALLVAWGGLNKQAEQLRLTQRLKVRVWTDEDVPDRLFETYEQLPDRIRSLIPLKRAWSLSQE